MSKEDLQAALLIVITKKTRVLETALDIYFHSRTNIT